MPKISVVVPIYNVEPYLKRCIDSILNQTFTDFDLILVDDGSPDNCGKICDEYAKKDERIIVIHQENGGLSAARNAGIDWAFANSDSEWITFIDSDDFISCDYLKTLLDIAIENNVSCSICGYVETDDFEYQFHNNNAIENFVLSPDDAYEKMSDTDFCRKVSLVIACSKLYKKSSFEDIRYPVGKIHEDVYTTYKVLFKLDKIAITTLPLYCYYQSENSIMRSNWTPKRLDIIEGREWQLEFFEKNGYKKAFNCVLIYYINNIIFNINAIINSPYKSEKYDVIYRKKLRFLLKKYRKKFPEISLVNYSRPYFYAYPRLKLFLRVYRIFKIIILKFRSKICH